MHCWGIQWFSFYNLYLLYFVSFLETQAPHNRINCHCFCISNMQWSSPRRLQVQSWGPKQFFALLWQWHHVSDDSGAIFFSNVYIYLFACFCWDCILWQIHSNRTCFHKVDHLILGYLSECWIDGTQAQMHISKPCFSPYTLNSATNHYVSPYLCLA